MRRARQHGFTLFEMMIALVLTPLVVTAISRVYGSSESLAQESRVILRAHEDLRRNLVAVANVLRDADVDTLTGLDAQGYATQPSFRRVTGADVLGRLYSSVETLRWRSSPIPVNGIATPGELVLVKDGTEQVVAVRVPQDGFVIQLVGNTVEVRMSSYYATSEAHMTLISGRTAVSLRN